MNSRIRYAWMPSPLGDVLLVADDEALRGLYFHDQKYFPSVDAAWSRQARSPVIDATRRQLDEYFAGSRSCFDLPLAPQGTPFQRAIWNAIAEVPCGQTRTYADLAARVGHAGSARAAGAATGRNPLSIIVSCHRIIGSDGSLTRYAGGLDRKKRLLALERTVVGTARRAA